MQRIWKANVRKKSTNQQKHTTMQNVQNSDTQRVINLVNTYRTQMREKHLTRDLSKKEIEYLEQNGGKGITKANIGVDAKKIEVYCFNEQLLGHFYAVVAGSNAEKDILQQLLPDFYDTTIYTQDEEVFLIEHFREMVNYIIQTPLNNWDETEGSVYHDSFSKIEYLIPEEILNLIETRVQIPNDAVSYNLCTGLGQFAVRFNGQKVLWSTDDASLDWYESFFFERIEKCYVGTDFQLDAKNLYKRTNSWIRSYAWARVAMYANNVHTLRVNNGDFSLNYNVLMAYIPFDGGIKNTHEAYNHLKQGGKMILLCPISLLWRESSEESMFRELLVKDCSIEEIIQLPSSVMKSHERDFCIIIAEKGRERTCTTFIDATKAFKQKRIYSEEDAHRNDYNVLDVEAWDTLLQNNGVEQETCLHKIAQLKSSTLNPNMLLPQICVLEKPLENENPLPLSKLCNRVVSKVKEIDYDLPTDTLWVRNHNLSNVFQGALNVSTLETADCPNNPPHTNDYKFAETGEFIDEQDFKSFFEGSSGCWLGLGQQTEIGMRVVDYRRCTFIDGTKDAVLFKKQNDGVNVALIRATGKPIAIDSGINVFIPNGNIDALSLVALLRLPIVYRQIRAYEKFGLSNYMDDILVPTDLRIIRDEEQRMLKVGNAISELEEKLANQKKSVRMRKHALTQSLSSIEAMFDALNAYRIRKKGSINDRDIISRVKGTTVREVFDFLAQNIKDMMPALEHIADVEYTFRKPEWIDPEIFIEDYIFQHENGWLNFKPIMTWENGHNVAKEDIKNPSNGEIILQKGQSINQFFFPTDALEHVFKNIISNAQAWAFDDQSREDYQLKFSWQMKGTALIIEIENNGTPIPRDRDTASLLEYGVSTALHHDGHNGIGCNEIDDIMQRYDGKVEIVSTPEKEFTVKYILTFNRSNTGRTF